MSRVATTSGSAVARVGRRLAAVALVLLAAGCGAAPRPSPEALRAAAEERARRTDAPADWAALGWHRYLGGDAEGARAAFDWAAGEPLGALGEARLARDALDPAAALAAAARAAAGDGWVAIVGRRWAEEAADGLPEGAERLRRALGAGAGERAPVKAARHTVRISFLPYLHRRRLVTSPPRVRGDRVRALGREWALDDRWPAPDPDGLVLTEWPLPPGPAHLEVAVGGPMTAWRDGRVVCATPSDRVPPAVVRFTAPGEGPLLMAWAADRRPRVWRWTRPPPAGDPENFADPVARVVRLEAALADGDVETAHALLAGAGTAGWDPWRARLASLDEALPGGVARDRAEAHWRAALSLAPARAHLELGRLGRRAGRLERAREHLVAAVEAAPHAHEAHRALFRLYLDLGWRHEAGEALAAALRTAPEPCRLVDDQAAWLQGGDDAAARARLVETYATCGRPVDAAEMLLEMGRPRDALARLDAAGDDGRRASRVRARARIALGELEAARDLRSRDESAAGALLVADLAGALAGDDRDAALSEALRALVRRFPTAHEAVEIIAAWPAWSPFAPLAVDTEAAIAAFEAVPPLPGPAVRVLDHASLLYFADGRRLRRVHEILAIRSREAAETYGEIGLPVRVRLVALYTRKADGRRLHAEESPDKDTISMPDLEDGDYVVAEYLETGDNGYLYDHGFLTPRVYFRGTDLPIFRQILEVFSPDDRPPGFQALAGAPEPERVTLDGRAGLRFEVRQVPLLPAEPDAAPAAVWLPSVRVGRDVSLVEDLEYVRDRVLARRRRSAVFDAWVVEKAGDGDARSRALRLTRAVRERIDDRLGLLEDDVTRMLETGNGNRALVLSAALEADGIPHTLYLGRPAVHAPAGPFLQVTDFPYPLIRVEGPGEPWWLDPGPDRAPAGFIGHGMLGGDAVVVWPPEAPAAPVPLPRTRAVEDRRVVRMTLHWAADGTLNGEVVDRLEGQEAIVVGGYLARLEPEMRPRLMERLLVGVVGAAHVTDFDDPIGAQHPDGPLTLRYRFEARPGDSLDLGLFPASPGRSHAALAERETPLVIDLPTDQTVEVVLRGDRPLTVDGKAVRRAEGPHRYALEIDADEDEVRFTASLRIAGGRIDPPDYPAFARWARWVDAAERVRVRLAR